jgi:hypothetical protein
MDVCGCPQQVHGTTSDVSGGLADPRLSTEHKALILCFANPPLKKKIAQPFSDSEREYSGGLRDDRSYWGNPPKPGMTVTRLPPPFTQDITYSQRPMNTGKHRP